MRKGQTQHWFSDIIPGVLIILIAYSVLSFGNAHVQTLSSAEFAARDAFDRELLLLLQSPATEKPGLTYGDWLGLLIADPTRHASEEQAFATALDDQIRTFPITSVYQTKDKLIYSFDVRFAGSETSVVLNSFVRAEPYSTKKPIYQTDFYFPTEKEPLHVDVALIIVPVKDTFGGAIGTL